MMGVVSGFLSVSSYVKVAALIVMVAQILNWIAYCTSSWWVVTTAATGAPYTHYGLWRACNSGFLPKCAVLDGTGSDNMAAAQTFANFGFVSLNLGCLLLLLYILLDTCRGNREAGLATGVTLLTSGVTWLIAVCVFAGYIDQNYSSSNYGFSFGLAIATFMLALVAGVLMAIAGCTGGSGGLK